MKNLLFVGALALSITQVKAQSWLADSVTMGPGYANDVYYSMNNGAQPAVSNTNWHLAFQMTPPGAYGNVSIIANHVQGGVKVFSLHMRAATNFNTLSAADTLGKTGTAQELFNSDSSWNYGAFNRWNDPANPYDYSWGIYDVSSHNVIGDSLYLIKVSNGATSEVYKIWVKQYVSNPSNAVQWQFRIAKFDGTQDTTISIYRAPNFTDRLFAYYNVTTKTVIDREPSRSAWDILFTRYREYIAGAPGVPYYPVTGVLSNFDVVVHEKQLSLANDTIGYAGYAYSKKLNEIGSDWKTFNMSTNQYQLADSTYFFVKTKGQVSTAPDVYQLHFTGFGGGANGKIWFQKRFLASLTSVGAVNTSVSAYHIAPNPASNNVAVMLDAKEVSDAHLMVTDLNGRMVYNKVVTVNNGLNVFTLNTSNVSAGTYIVTLSNGLWKVAEKLVIQH